MANEHREHDLVAAALYSELLSAITEEMGSHLRRAAFSPNIKERRDYSCALFLGDGTLVAQAAHIPVHLGSSSLSVRAVLASLELEEGDEAILNDPFAGGTHLPDVTLVRPVYLKKGRGRRNAPDFFLLNRAHHADIGGATPGSMGLARDVHAEGFRIPPVHFVRGGELSRDFATLFRAQVRQSEERFADLVAQRAANTLGESRLRDLAMRESLPRLVEGARALPLATAFAMRQALSRLARGVHRFEDRLDGDGFSDRPIRIRLALTIARGGATFDFRGSDEQVDGPVNANLAITLSCVGYALRCLLAGSAPFNDGVLEPVRVIAPKGSIVNAVAPAAVAAGNVETSQRIVDVVFGALSKALPARVGAASAGTMSNTSFGNSRFTYYETMGGGSGATAMADGASAVQTHMTNTLNTPIEMLEVSCPLRVVRYAIRRGSGGRGAHRGGDGIVREFEAREPMVASLLAERHARGPYGLNGGRAGRAGAASVRRAGSRAKEKVPAKATLALRRGDVLCVETPGGGGHGVER